MKHWKAELITSKNEANKAYPVYWSITNEDKNSLRIAIDVYKADRITLDAAKLQVKELLTKLNQS